MRDLQQAGRQCLPPALLRPGHLRKLYVHGLIHPISPARLTSPGQASLPDTCPVCAHTPLSADLCKPNKALRTTLKAFLRTEEKKREKERQSATPAVANGTTPLEGTPTQPDAPAPPSVPEEKAPEEQTQPASVTDGLSEQPLVEAAAAEPQPHDAEPGHEAPEEAPARVRSSSEFFPDRFAHAVNRTRIPKHCLPMRPTKLAPRPGTLPAKGTEMKTPRSNPSSKKSRINHRTRWPPTVWDSAWVPGSPTWPGTTPGASIPCPSRSWAAGCSTSPMQWVRTCSVQGFSRHLANHLQECLA